ncbi:MAG: hypothetical protein JWR16_3254, partial [Nevskia sp.]|nr:hypothetical protein [Nevskia sp.]
WILDPTQDAVFIIAAPLLVLALSLLTFHFVDAGDAAALIILVHMVMTVAHHLPTFIRIYGDVDLFRRFKWTFLLGPLVPLTFAAGALTYINLHNYPVENFLYLFILLAIWDPYHFLMQHYGFMRIYDRHNRAPQRLASRMDLWLCVGWFAFIMLAATDWLAGLLEDLFNTAQLPLFALIPDGALPLLTNIAAALAIAMTVAYVLYVVWCRRQGYFVSRAKLSLFVVTFGVMYLAYTPNQWIMQWAPGWSFKVGFAALGIVHMTQYLAIVWRYNRSLAAHPQRSRPGWFRCLHARGGWIVAAGYVIFCLSYGEVLTGTHGGRWLMSVLMAAGFTSTLMHYYFDGFIWKMRHRQTRENLAMTDVVDKPAPELRMPASTAAAPSVERQPQRFSIALRQLCYFGIPMTALTLGAILSWSGPGANYAAHMYQAQLLSQQGHADQALSEARIAFASMSRQLPFARKLAQLQPTSARKAALALVVYNRSKYQDLLLPTLSGTTPDTAQLADYRASLDEAAHALDGALRMGGSLAGTGHEKMTAADGQRMLDSWKSELQRLQNG